MSELIPTTLTGLEPAAPQLPGQAGAVDRYAQPGWLTPAGQQDRKAEVDHVLRVRVIGRQASETAALEARAAFEELAHQEAMGRVVTEAKYKLHRAKTESQVLGGEDPELEAKFAILDDTLFQGVRLGLHRFLA